jgi:hypothetical protein
VTPLGRRNPKTPPDGNTQTLAATQNRHSTQFDNYETTFFDNDYDKFDTYFPRTEN